MKTSDVSLAAAFLALGYKLSGVDRFNPRHMVFEFESDLAPLRTMVNESAKAVHIPSIKDVETAWANRTLMVNAVDYSEAMKRMKSLIHSSQ